MTQQRWPAVLGSAIAALAKAHPAYETLLQPNGEVGSTTLGMIMAPPPEPKKPKGSRGGEVYAIAPSEIEGLNIIWRDRPLLIWEGAIARVSIRDAETGKVLWSQEVSPEDRWVAYAGEPLQPGCRYECGLCDRHDNLLTNSVTFQVLASEQWEGIAAALAKKEAALQAEDATSEAIALERAAYFAEQQLWADVLMEACSVTNPSADLMRLLQYFGVANSEQSKNE